MSPLSLGRPALVAGALLLSLPAVVAAETTEYTVTFVSTWSSSTHPVNFPPSPHYSGLIGGSHTDQVAFWAPGALASTGIKNMAELGGKTALTSEVNAAITAGTANAVLSGGGIGLSPGTRTLTFTMDSDFPLVTLVSMLAPSPDWFVGVTGLSLRENDAWIPELVVDLHVYDAGTDSGVNYTSSNQPTVPAENIAQLTTGSFAVTNLVGTFTFTRTGAVGVNEGLPRNAERLVALGPNPLRRSTSFQIRIPRDRRGDLSVYGVGGQLVRSLFRGATAGADRVVSWNGRDEAGALVPSGVYYVALRVDGEESRTRKVVVTR